MTDNDRIVALLLDDLEQGVEMAMSLDIPLYDLVPALDEHLCSFVASGETLPPSECQRHKSLRWVMDILNTLSRMELPLTTLYLKLRWGNACVYIRSGKTRRSVGGYGMYSCKGSAHYICDPDVPLLPELRKLGDVDPAKDIAGGSKILYKWWNVFLNVQTTIA